MSKYGKSTAATSLAVIAFVVACALFFLQPIVLRAIAMLTGAAAGFLVLNFFRDPERTIPQEKNIVVSPADGKIVVIKELFEGEYLRSDAVQVSIFMSPLDVHVNRFPISGTVGMFRHVEGKYLVAFHDKSSELNERTIIGVEQNGYKIVFKQIAGALARRIVAPITAGQPAECGERFGMIKFGSRVDVIMPRRSVVRVALHDRVVAGETILASFT